MKFAFSSVRGICLAAMLLDSTLARLAAQPDLADLPRLSPGRTVAVNALWIENDLKLRFNSSNRVVVADLQGPAVITMIHFAMPATLQLNRDVLLRMYWDGETSPSVDVPLVDFFCDPAGLHESVNTILVNKRRGFNAYFPMPFRRSAKIELLYDGPVPPGEKLWKMMPCYSYVMYKTEKSIPSDTGYFHAAWRQEKLRLGQRDYLALEARGEGKFVGWNVTVRKPGSGHYPVDENEKFYIDGESTASVEFQGLEDSFGFSWGFPGSESSFPRTGYFPFLQGAAAYRFFCEDAIHFKKSLRVAIGFGINESPFFRREFSKAGSDLQLSSTVYWYQTEPHAPLPAMPPAAMRAPAPEQSLTSGQEKLPATGELKSQGVKLCVLCGHPGKEVIYAEKNFGATIKKGFAWNGWSPPVYYARADDKEVAIELAVPQNASGRLRIFVTDPDEFQGGRKEKIVIGGGEQQSVENFEAGKWLDYTVRPDQTAEGRLLVQAVNLRENSNAVISRIDWIGN